jgi:hypothetical protein
MANTTKAERVTIQLGEIPLNVYQLPDGSYRLSGRNITEAVGQHANTLQRILDIASLEVLPDAERISAGKSGAPFWAVPPRFAVKYWARIAFTKSNTKAYSLLSAIPSEHSLGISVESCSKIISGEASRVEKAKSLEVSKGKKTPERQVEFALSKEHPGCKRQVRTPVGIIDLLTPSEIIEVKTAKDWKGALGQVLVYGTQYPSHQKRIHLFGRVDGNTQLLIEQECARFDVVVTWSNDED